MKMRLRIPAAPQLRWSAAAQAGLIGAALILCWIYVSHRYIAPFGDMVAVYELLQRHGDGSLTDLIQAVVSFRDNEHKTYVPFVIWWLDWYLFQSLGLLPQLCMFGCVGFLAYHCTAWSRAYTAQRTIVWLIACLLLLSPWHYENLLWDKQLHVYLSLLFSVLAIRLLTHEIEPSQNQLRAAALATLAAILGSFSFAYGAAVWPPLLVYAFSRHGLNKSSLIVLVGAVMVLGYYGATYEELDHHASVYESIFDVLTAIAYVFRFLGPGIFLPMEFPLFERSVGLLGLLAVAGAAWIAYITQQPLNRAQHVSLLVCLTACGIAFLTALGRIGLTSGTESRYLVVNALYCCAMPGVLSILLPKLFHQLKAKVVLAGCVAISLLCSWPSLGALFFMSAQTREAAAAAAMRLPPTLMGSIPNDKKFQRKVWSPYFRDHANRQDIQALGYWKAPIATLQQELTLKPTKQCIGRIDQTQARPDIDNAWSARGWALDLSGRPKAQNWIIARDQHDMIVGYGTTGLLSPALRRWAVSQRVIGANTTGLPTLHMNNSGWAKLFAYMQQSAQQGVPWLEAESTGTKQPYDWGAFEKMQLFFPSIFSGLQLQFRAKAGTTITLTLTGEDTLCEFASVEVMTAEKANTTGP